MSYVMKLKDYAKFTIGLVFGLVFGIGYGIYFCISILTSMTVDLYRQWDIERNGVNFQVGGKGKKTKFWRV